MEYSYFQSLLDGGMAAKEALSKLTWRQSTPTGQEIYW